jgi:hypothetical protein
MVLVSSRVARTSFSVRATPVRMIESKTPRERVKGEFVRSSSKCPSFTDCGIAPSSSGGGVCGMASAPRNVAMPHKPARRMPRHKLKVSLSTKCGSRLMGAKYGGSPAKPSPQLLKLRPVFPGDASWKRNNEAVRQERAAKSHTTDTKTCRRTMPPGLRHRRAASSLPQNCPLCLSVRRLRPPPPPETGLIMPCTGGVGRSSPSARWWPCC